MRLKLPFKKYRNLAFNPVLYGMLVLLVSLAVAAQGNLQGDRALFWSIQKDGQPAGYLLGTIHSEDPRVLDFSKEFLDRLGSNQVFAMELVPDMLTLERLTGYMHLPPGKSLESVIGADRYQALKAALSAYRVPETFFSRMKPWAAMMTLSTPPPETGFFMDLSLSLRASGKGLEVIGLETLEQQLSFLENMPMEMQLSLLDQAIAESGQVVDVHNKMVNAYLENDLQSLQRLSDEQLEEVGEIASRYFTESGIHERNIRMARVLLSQLENNSVFAAVGALHLPGEKGLLNILRQHGYDMTPMAMPLPTATPVQP